MSSSCFLAFLIEVHPHSTMKKFLIVAIASLQICIAAEPLRIFIRSGEKTHGPGCHDHPAFLKDWTKLLNERGAKATGGDNFPTAEQLSTTDVPSSMPKKQGTSLARTARTSKPT